MLCPRLAVGFLSDCCGQSMVSMAVFTMQAVVLPVTQPFTMGASPTKEPLLGPSGGSLTHRRISYARMGPPLAKRRSSDEPDTARSVSEFDWGGDMTTTSRTASRSRRSSVSEHAFPQVNDALTSFSRQHLACLAFQCCIGLQTPCMLQPAILSCGNAIMQIGCCH